MKQILTKTCKDDLPALRRTRADRSARRRAGATRFSVWDWYCRACYEWLGQRLDARQRTRLAERLKQADLNMTSGMFLSLAVSTSAIVMVVGGTAAAVHFGVVMGTPYWFPLTLTLGLAVGSMTAAAFPYILSSRIAKRREKIEKELPFSLSELSVLASIGLSPMQIFSRMAQRDRDATMTSEFRKVMFKASIQGKDLITALTETARESPSKTLRDTFWDLGHMIHQGGNLASYLTSRASDVLELKRSRQTLFIDTLGTFGDMYVTGVLLSVVFLGMGAFLVNAFGTGPMDGATLLAGLAYFLMPALVLVVTILLGTAHARVE